MGTKIYLIRHGEVEGANPRRYNGHIDVPLSENGVAQLKRLAAFLSGKDDKRESSKAGKLESGKVGKRESK